MAGDLSVRGVSDAAAVPGVEETIKKQGRSFQEPVDRVPRHVEQPTAYQPPAGSRLAQCLEKKIHNFTNVDAEDGQNPVQDALDELKGTKYKWYDPRRLSNIGEFLRELFNPQYKQAKQTEIERLENLLYNPII